MDANQCPGCGAWFQWSSGDFDRHTARCDEFKAAHLAVGTPNVERAYGAERPGEEAFLRFLSAKKRKLSAIERSSLRQAFFAGRDSVEVER